MKPFSLMELETGVCAHLRQKARYKADIRLKFAGELAIDDTRRQMS